MTWRLFFTDTDYMLSNNCLLRSSTSTTSSAENQGTLWISFHSFLLWHDSFAGIQNRMRMACSRISNICAYFTFSSIHLFICLYEIIAVFYLLWGFFLQVVVSILFFDMWSLTKRHKLKFKILFHIHVPQSWHEFLNDTLHIIQFALLL